MKVLIQLLAWCLSVAASAEMRTWTAADGATVKAEFQLRTMKLVRLKTAAGKILNVPFERLSSGDQVYVELRTPPVLGVEVDPNKNYVNDSVTRRKGEGYLVLDFEIEIRKKSRLSYSRPLTLDLYVVGEQEVLGHYSILQHHSRRLVFGTKATKKTIKADQVLLRRTPESTKTEFDYIGYLLIITDERDEVIVVRSNTKKFEKNVEKFSKLKVGSFFYPGTLEAVKNP